MASSIALETDTPPQAQPPDASGGLALRTLLIPLAVLSALMMVRLFVSEHYLFPTDAYVKALGGRLESARIDELLAARSRSMVWAYLFTPLVLLVRILIVAGLAQLGLLLAGIEVRMSRLVAAALVAYVAMLASYAARLTILLTLPPGELTLEAISARAGGIPAAWIGWADAFRPLYLVLQQLTAFEATWIVVFAVAIARLARLSFLRTLPAVAGLWLLLTLFQVALLYFLVGMRI